MSKLYFYKCTHFLSYLLFSSLFIHQFHSYTKIFTLIPFIPIPITCIPTPIPRIPTLIPRILTTISCISTLISRIPTLIPFIPVIPTLIFRILIIPALIFRIPIIPTLIPCIPIIPLILFPDSPFWLLQIAISDFKNSFNIDYIFSFHFSTQFQLIFGGSFELHLFAYIFLTRSQNNVLRIVFVVSS